MPFEELCQLLGPLLDVMSLVIAKPHDGGQDTATAVAAAAFADGLLTVLSISVTLQSNIRKVPSQRPDPPMCTADLRAQCPVRTWMSLMSLYVTLVDLVVLCWARCSKWLWIACCCPYWASGTAYSLLPVVGPSGVFLSTCVGVAPFLNPVAHTAVSDALIPSGTWLFPMQGRQCYR